MSSRTRGRDRSGHMDSFAPRRRRFEAVLRPLGVWDAFAAMPQAFQHMFWKLKLPDPQVVFDQTVPADSPSDRRMRKAIDAAFRDASVEVEGTKLAARDYIAVLGGAVTLIKNAPPSFMKIAPESVAAFYRDCGPRIEKVYEDNWQALLGAVFDAVRGPLIAHGRLERFVLASKMEARPAAGTGKTEVKVVVRAERPEERRVFVDGKPRPMYRAAEALGATVKWLSWKDPASGAELPIYVQSHALKRLKERANLPEAAPYLEAWLGVSLDEPVVVERHGRDLLVEFRIQDSRVGYLIVTPMKDQGLVAVRTFKFLTMENTPEFHKLRRRLQAERRDLQYNGLDDLKTFIRTDVGTDPTLRPILDECGLGHLFTLPKGDDFDAQKVEPMAAEMKKYFRLAA